MAKRAIKPIKARVPGWFGAGVKEAHVEATDRFVTVRPLGSRETFTLDWGQIAEMIVWRVTKDRVSRQ